MFVLYYDIMLKNPEVDEVSLEEINSIHFTLLSLEYNFVDLVGDFGWPHERLPKSVKSNEMTY